MRIDDIPTPALVVDEGRLQRNISHMASLAKEAGVALRPHIKTHKSIQIADLQRKASACGITCAKVSEAIVMAEGGIRDILIAYPTVLDWQLEKAMELASYCTVKLAYDSFHGARRISAFAEKYNRTIEVYQILNTGQNRDGVSPLDAALDLAKHVKDLTHVELIGLMTHEGHVYRSSSEEEVVPLAMDSWESMVKTKELLEREGIPIRTVSVGSTPTCYKGGKFKGVTEWRPGTYVFNDMQEVALGVPKEHCSLKVLASVVSHPAPFRYVLDAGSKTLSLSYHKDYTYGFIEEVPSCRILSLSEEHAVLHYEGEGLSLMDRVHIIPIHVCPVVNLSDRLYICSLDRVSALWSVDARGKVN